MKRICNANADVLSQTFTSSKMTEMLEIKPFSSFSITTEPAGIFVFYQFNYWLVAMSKLNRLTKG